MTSLRAILSQTLFDSCSTHFFNRAIYDGLDLIWIHKKRTQIELIQDKLIQLKSKPSHNMVFLLCRDIKFLSKLCLNIHFLVLWHGFVIDVVSWHGKSLYFGVVLLKLLCRSKENFTTTLAWKFENFICFTF